MKIRFLMSLFLALGVLGVAAVSSAAQELCNCEDERVQSHWEHSFDTQDVDLGYNNGHSNMEGGTCFDYHGPWFCNGGIGMILEGSDGMDIDQAVAAFVAQVQALPAADLESVRAFVQQFPALAALDVEQGAVVLQSCDGAVSFDLSETALAALELE